MLRALVAATIRERCSELPIVRLLFEGDDYLRVGSIRWRQLLEGGVYSMATTT